MKKFYRGTSNLFENLSMVFLAGILLMVVLQVFFRYILRITVPWTEEAARYLGIWMVFMGATAAIAQEAHIRITFLLERFPEKTRQLFELLISSVMFLFNLIVLFGSFQLVKLNWGQKAVTFPISVSSLYLALAVSSVFIAFFLLLLIWNKLRIFFKWDSSEWKF